MEEKKDIRQILTKTVYIVACIALLAILVVAFSVLVQTIQMETSSTHRLLLHDFLAVGFVAFFVVFLFPRLRHTFRWLMKFTHEFTHLVFAILFIRKIYRFKVDSDESYVSYSNGWFGYHLITLAPYFVPVFTLVLLPWRFTTGNPFFLHVIDLLIGATYAFHICCWAKHTRLHQTDIIGPGIVLSLLCISIFQILNFCLIALTPSSGVQLAIRRVFWEFPSEFIHILFSYLNLLV